MIKTRPERRSVPVLRRKPFLTHGRAQRQGAESDDDDAAAAATVTDYGGTCAARPRGTGDC